MKKIYDFIDRISSTAISILRVFRRNSLMYRRIYPPSESQCIFILGNGPSLKHNLENNMDELKATDTFAVNKFCLTHEFSNVKPKYYLLLDPGFLIKNKSSRFFLSMQQKIIYSLVKETNWNMTLFIPSKTDMKNDWSKMAARNRNITITYINTNYASGFEPIIFTLYKYNLAMANPMNVLIGAIFLSLNMGYKNIYLLGADHSWIEDVRVNQKNQLYLYDKHFYGESKTLIYEDLERTIGLKMHNLLSSFAITFKQYHLLRKYAGHLSASIYNSTLNSHIDAFTRKDI